MFDLQEMKKYYEEKYRPMLQEVIFKCEDEFEKKIIYIAGGSLGVSFSFITNLVDIKTASFLWMLLSGWSLLIICICLNLHSHPMAKKSAQDTMNEIDKDSFSVEDVNKSIEKGNRKTNLMNHLTIWSVTAGIALIVLCIGMNVWERPATDTMQTPNNPQYEKF